MNLIEELKSYLNSLEIYNDNIGEIRADCFVPWDSGWNRLVRELTAQRELGEEL